MIFVLRRLGIFLLTLVVASMVVFAVLAVLPGDPAEVAAGTQATPEQVAALRAEYGLNGSVPARYVRWLGDLVTGNLGNTFVSKRSIASEIGTRLQVTLPLVLLGWCSPSPSRYRSASSPPSATGAGPARDLGALARSGSPSPSSGPG